MAQSACRACTVNSGVGAITTGAADIIFCFSKAEIKTGVPVPSSEGSVGADWVQGGFTLEVDIRSRDLPASRQ